jgi:hypothetical protein
LPTTRSAEHVYVYAAIEGEPADLPAAGMPGGGAPRFMVVDDEAKLIVSSVPGTIYNAASIEAHLADLDWVARAGAAHHAVVDALAAHAVVVPFGLFTIFTSEAATARAMRDRLPALRQAFSRLRGREEWVLRITKPDPGRADAPGERVRPASGTQFLAQKAEARRQSVERMDRLARDAVAAYHALDALAESSRVKPVDPSGSLLVDAAFLVRPSEVERLKQALIESADRLLRDGCGVSLTGPWPAYSFASLETTSDG